MLVDVGLGSTPSVLLQVMPNLRQQLIIRKKRVRVKCLWNLPYDMRAKQCEFIEQIMKLVSYILRCA